MGNELSEISIEHQLEIARKDEGLLKELYSGMTSEFMRLTFQPHLDKAAQRVRELEELLARLRAAPHN